MLQDSGTNNRKLPAWLGSILFHTAVILLIILWFSFTPPSKSAPGERIAVGSIVRLSDTENKQSKEELQSDVVPTAEQQTEQFSDARLDISPAVPAIAPGRLSAETSIPSAAALTESFQSGTQYNTGIGNQSGETTVSIFGTKGQGTKFMYVFDRSGSMEGLQIRKAKAELLKSLDSLGDFHQFNILFYNNEGLLWRQGRKLIFATKTEKENAARFVTGVLPAGGTNHFEPLKEAIYHRPDVIFFLTDGERNDDLTPAQLADIEHLNNRIGRGIQINVIQFGRGKLSETQSPSLQQLAAENQGQYRYINASEL